MKLECVDLHKKYGAFEALKGIDYVFSEGIYGLLGPNGAGKSTWIGLLTSNLRATSGDVKWNGESIYQLGNAYLEEIGYVPQNQNLYPYFTGREFMMYMAALKGVDAGQARRQIPELLASVNLSPQAEKKIRAYSGGMKQRLLIAQALLGAPRLIIMDEPTAGLDPRERIRIRNLIAKSSLNKIILIATHVVSDIEYTSKEILLLKKGKLIRVGSPDRLEDDVRGVVFEQGVEPEQLDDFMRSQLVVEVRQQQGQIYARYLRETSDPETGGVGVPVRPNLDDVYLHYFREEGEYVSP